MQNILTRPFTPAYEAAPFDRINQEDFLPAFRHLIEESQEEIDKIAQDPRPPDFENTIAALSYAGYQLDRLSSLFFNLNSAETNDEMQGIAQEVSPLLSEYSSRIVQNEALFERIRQVHENLAGATLSDEDSMLLDQTYKGFVRSGALLGSEEKKKMEEINKELSIKSLQFGQNVLAATNEYIKNITDIKDLAGIPESILTQYAEEAKERGLQGYAISLQLPSYGPFMTYSSNRALRKELSSAYGKRSFTGAFDNRLLISEIIKLRHEKALMLGYKNYAEYVLEERMAGSPDKVNSFLEELLEKAKPYAEKELEALRAMAQEDGIDTMQSYDHAYYAEKLRKEKYDLNDEELKPFFPLPAVEQAVFNLAGKLFGLSFRERTDLPVYHEEVKLYEVMENDSFKALLYTDYHPRPGKRAGAWMTSYKSQFKKDGENQRPHISVVCNFSKPTPETPSLLTFREVTTLFHEFGHALHGILANTTYPTLSGTSVKWDFVELPSQFMENYCYEPEFLKTFARHYNTGEVLSDEKIAKLSASKSFLEGYQTMRQLGFGILDMAYHTRHEMVSDVKVFETDETKATQMYPSDPETATSTSFSHIFQGGYSAGYYSYKWAEVLDADAFAFFREGGIFNPETAAGFKKLLSAGGTKEPMELYKEFRGREPDVENLLKRAFH